MRVLILAVVCATSLTAGLGCAKKKKKGDSSGSSSVIDPNFEKPISATSILNIGVQTLAGTKLVSKNDVSTVADPAMAVFEAEIYPKVRQYCAESCHNVNQLPFASDAVTLAFETAKPFMTVNPEDSQMIKNIKASHNGTNPAWAAEIGPAITKVAEALK